MQSFIFDHGKHERNGIASCDAEGFQENFPRWPENLFQKNIFFTVMSWNIKKENALRQKKILKIATHKI